MNFLYIMYLSRIRLKKWYNLLNKNTKILTLVIFVVFVSGTFSIQSAFAAVGTPGCGMFEIRPGCELGGWMHLLMGDALTGGMLGVLFHYMAHKTNGKLEAILEEQEVLRKRRKDYAVIQLKNLFNTILYTLGNVNKDIINHNRVYHAEKNDDRKLWLRGILLSEIRAEEAKMGRILQSTSNTLISSSDVLDPEISKQIAGTITFVAEIARREEEDGSLNMPKYDICKTKIKFLTELFSDYSFDSHEFKREEVKQEEVKASSRIHSRVNTSMRYTN